jgi:hypothetical protein
MLSVFIRCLLRYCTIECGVAVLQRTYRDNPDGTDDSFEAARLLKQLADDSGGTSKFVSLGEATPD